MIMRVLRHRVTKSDRQCATPLVTRIIRTIVLAFVGSAAAVVALVVSDRTQRPVENAEKRSQEAETPGDARFSVRILAGYSTSSALPRHRFDWLVWIS